MRNPPRFRSARASRCITVLAVEPVEMCLLFSWNMRISVFRKHCGFWRTGRGWKAAELDYSREAKEQADKKAQLLQINKEAAKYFYYQLYTDKGKHALTYLKKGDSSL